MSTDAPTPPARRRRPSPRGLLRRKAAGRYCGAPESTWDKWTAAGLNPTPIRIAGSVYWSRAELAEWCRHHCPDRATWTPIWNALVTARRLRAVK